MSDELWGVGRYDGPDGPVAWPIGHEEVRRDLASAMRRLEGLGVGRGSRVLFCSLLSEAGQFWPWILATMLRGAQLSCADATEGEARRVATFCDALHYDAVIGITGAVLDGLEALGRDPAEVVAGGTLVLARPGAAERLAGSRPFVLCGPAVAVDGETDPDEWLLEADAEGRVLVTSRRPRATAFVRTPTAATGRMLGR